MRNAAIFFTLNNSYVYCVNIKTEQEIANSLSSIECFLVILDESISMFVVFSESISSPGNVLEIRDEDRKDTKLQNIYLSKIHPTRKH